MNEFLTGLQWAGVATMYFVGILFALTIGWRFYQWMMSVHHGTDDVGAHEGDLRHFNLRREINELDEERF